MRHALFVFDLKGDANLFHHTRRAAEGAGRTFKYLIIDAVGGLDTYHLPPFQMLPPENRNLMAMAETLSQCFGMEHGPIYGGQYYSQTNLAALLNACKVVSEKMENPTFHDVAQYLLKHRKEFKDADQVLMTFMFLTEQPSLIPHPVPERNIDLRQAVEDGHVVYIWARTMRQAMTARLVAGLVLYSLIAVCQERDTLLNGPPKRTTVIIDEFQTLVSASFADVMAQCGAWLSLVLSNQSTSQLKNRDISLSDFVFENTMLRQCFTCVGHEDIEQLQAQSKDKIKSLGGSSVQGLSSSVSFKDTIVPSLERDTVLEVSATFGQSLVVINDGRGHREPQIIQQRHEYENLSHLPMPRKSSAEATKLPDTNPPPKKAPLTAEAKARDERISASIAMMQAMEAWVLETEVG